MAVLAGGFFHMYFVSLDCVYVLFNSEYPREVNRHIFSRFLFSPNLQK